MKTKTMKMTTHSNKPPRLRAILIFCFLLLFCGQSQLLRADQILIGHWKLDGDPGDSTGRHPDGVLHGAHSVWQTTNQVAGSGSLALNAGNQADSWIQIADTPDLVVGTNDFSVSYWGKKRASNNDYRGTYGVAKWKTGANPGQNEWALTIGTLAYDDKPFFGIESGVTGVGTGSSENLSLNVWHHLVGVRRQAALELYVDGVFVSRLAIPVGTVVNHVPRDLYIGSSAISGYGANALYDDLQIYNFALSNGGATTGQIAGGDIAFLFANPGQDTRAARILTQPDNLAVLPGSNAVFTVLATNSPPLTYQWRLNATSLFPSGTNATLTITNVDATKLGFYDVIVSNTFGPATSVKAKLSFPELGISTDGLGAIQIGVEGIIGSNARLDWSSNLTAWTTLTNIMVTNNPLKFIDPTAVGARTRYYRALFQ